MCRAGRRPEPGLGEIGHGLLAQLATHGVICELLNMLTETIRVARLDRVGHGIDVLERRNHEGVEYSAARGEKPAVGHLAEPIMGEIKSLADAVKNVRAHERLHGGGSVRFANVSRPL